MNQNKAQSEPKMVELSVKVREEDILSMVPTYSNFATVQANGEEVSFVFYWRHDIAGKPNDQGLFVSPARPVSYVVVSMGHAKRFAEAILEQVNASPTEV